MGFNMLFYIIFGTNLLTGGPVPVAVFCLFFTSQKINTKRSPNAAKLFEEFSGPENTGWDKEVPEGVPRGGHNTPGRAWGPRYVLLLELALVFPLKRKQ